MSNLSFQNITSLPKTLLSFYWKYGFVNQKSLLFLWMLVVLLSFAGGIVWPNFNRWIVALFENPVPEGVSFIRYAMPTILVITFLNLSMTVSSLIRDAVGAKLWVNVENYISEILTAYTHNQSMIFWVNKMAGSINTQINYIISGLVDAFSQLWRAVGNLMIICVNGLLLFNINKYVCGLFVLSLGFRIWYAYNMRKRVKKAGEEASGAYSALSGKLIDSFSNHMIVKLFAGVTKEQKILQKPRQKRIQTRLYSRYTMRVFWALPGVLWDLLFGLTILFCCVLYQRGQITISEIIYTISVFLEVMSSVGMLINQLPEIIDKTAAANKAYKDLVIPLDIIDKENAKVLHVKRGKIQFNNIYFKYRNKYILKNLSLTINPGERVGIVGSSGAGKTTLVNLLMRFYEPQRGNITIDDFDITDVTQHSLRENISFIPQEPTMFNRTISENISYGKFNASFKEIKDAAKKASADKFIMDTEKGYDSLVGDRGIKLSGGQKQRIAIARAFLKNAPILVLDEATSALDSETEIAIQKSFDKLSRGRTTIAIAHRLSTLRNMDRIIVIDKGVVVEQGTHNSLLRKKGLYFKLWQMQSGGFLPENKK
nr:ABC transporter ATP-binding protein [Candidatus Enterousia merdequi]